MLQVQERSRRWSFSPPRVCDAEMEDFRHIPSGRGGFCPWRRRADVVEITPRPSSLLVSDKIRLAPCPNHECRLVLRLSDIQHPLYGLDGAGDLRRHVEAAGQLDL